MLHALLIHLSCILSCILYTGIFFVGLLHYDQAWYFGILCDVGKEKPSEFGIPCFSENGSNLGQQHLAAFSWLVTPHPVTQ